jgi:Domain of unknown function (DUF427)
MTETLARPTVPAAEERARLKEGVHIERSSRRVRTYSSDKPIADSEHVLLVYETKRPPAHWVPIADVRTACLEREGTDTIRGRLRTLMGSLQIGFMNSSLGRRSRPIPGGPDSIEANYQFRVTS